MITTNCALPDDEAKTMENFTTPELRVLLEALNGLAGPYRGHHHAGDPARTDAKIGNDLAQQVCDVLESRGELR